MIVALEIGAMIAALAAFAEILRRFRALAWFVFSILPVALLPVWISRSDEGPFFSIKIVLVLWGVAWLLACRDTRLADATWPRRAAVAIMAINLAELVVHDFLSGTLAGRLNAAAGAVVIATLPGPSKIRIERRRDFLWDIPYAWIVAYSLWNWTFVYLNFSAGSGQTIALLAAPLLVGLWDRPRWLQARAFVLGTALLLKFTSRSLATIGETPDWYAPRLGVLSAALALGSACLYAALARWGRAGGSSGPSAGRRLGVDAADPVATSR